MNNGEKKYVCVKIYSFHICATESCHACNRKLEQRADKMSVLHEAMNVEMIPLQQSDLESLVARETELNK